MTGAAPAAPRYRSLHAGHAGHAAETTRAMVLPGVLQHVDLPDLRQCHAGRELVIESTLRVAALPTQLPLKRNAVAI